VAAEVVCNALNPVGGSLRGIASGLGNLVTAFVKSTRCVAESLRRWFALCFYAINGFLSEICDLVSNLLEFACALIRDGGRGLGSQPTWVTSGVIGSVSHDALLRSEREGLNGNCIEFAEK